MGKSATKKFKIDSIYLEKDGTKFSIGYGYDIKHVKPELILSAFVALRNRDKFIPIEKRNNKNKANFDEPNEELQIGKIIGLKLNLLTGEIKAKCKFNPDTLNLNKNYRLDLGIRMNCSAIIKSDNFKDLNDIQSITLTKFVLTCVNTK